MEHNIPDYITITSALEKLDTEVTPSEVHGTLTGLLCTATSAKPEIWQHNLWPDTSLNSSDLLLGEALELFNQLHDITRLQLNDPNCEFQLLLPVDDDHIDNRVNALGDWCQAYLMGLALGGVKDFTSLPDSAQEVANDLVEIARAGSSYSLEGSEEDENAYAELVEYLRVGVLLINEELQPTKSSPQSESALH
jgi:yecA family protein